MAKTHTCVVAAGYTESYDLVHLPTYIKYTCTRLTTVRTYIYVYLVIHIHVCMWIYTSMYNSLLFLSFSISPFLSTWPLPIFPMTTPLPVRSPLQVVHVTSICCYRKLIGSKMEELRKTLYDIACHLSLGRDGISCKTGREGVRREGLMVLMITVAITYLASPEYVTLHTY